MKTFKSSKTLKMERENALNKVRDCQQSISALINLPDQFDKEEYLILIETFDMLQNKEILLMK